PPTPSLATTRHRWMTTASRATSFWKPTSGTYCGKPKNTSHYPRKHRPCRGGTKPLPVWVLPIPNKPAARAGTQYGTVGPTFRGCSKAIDYSVIIWLVCHQDTTHS